MKKPIENDFTITNADLKDIQCELLHPNFAAMGVCPNIFKEHPRHSGLLNYRCLKCGTVFCSLHCLTSGHPCK